MPAGQSGRAESHGRRQACWKRGGDADLSGLAPGGGLALHAAAAAALALAVLGVARGAARADLGRPIAVLAAALSALALRQPSGSRSGWAAQTGPPGPPHLHWPSTGSQVVPLLGQVTPTQPEPALHVRAVASQVPPSDPRRAGAGLAALAHRAVALAAAVVRVAHVVRSAGDAGAQAGGAGAGRAADRAVLAAAQVAVPHLQVPVAVSQTWLLGQAIWLQSAAGAQRLVEVLQTSSAAADRAAGAAALALAVDLVAAGATAAVLVPAAGREAGVGGGVADRLLTADRPAAPAALADAVDWIAEQRRAARHPLLLAESRGRHHRSRRARRGATRPAATGIQECLKTMSNAPFSTEECSAAPRPPHP